MVNSALSMVLRNHVETLAGADGRAVGTPGHKRARRYILDQIKPLNLTPYRGDSFELHYGTTADHFCNIIATAAGVSPSLPPLLIGAHYDTCGMMPGADDNAAAVAITLELCKLLCGKPLPRDVVFAFFDAEEPPHFLAPSMGSIRFYEDQMDQRKVHAVYILDLVGHDVPIAGLEDLMFVTGMESSNQWGSQLRGAEPSDSLRWAPVLNSYVGSMSDHHIFERHKHPYLFFSCGRWMHYHCPTDTPDRLNYSKMSVLTMCLLDLISRAGQVDFQDGKVDSTPDELHFLNTNVIPALSKMAPVEALRGRGDIDRLVSTILTRFQV